MGPKRLSCFLARSISRRYRLFFLQVSGQFFKFLLRKPSAELAFLVFFFRNLLQYLFIQFIKVGGLAIDAHDVALLGVETHSPSFGPNLKITRTVRESDYSPAPAIFCPFILKILNKD